MKLTRRKILWAGATAVALGAGGYKLFRGFEDGAKDSREIPARLRGAGLDVHVHAMGVGTGNSGCWMSDAMRRSIQARAGLWTLRLSIPQPDLDQAYIGYLIRRIHTAGFLKQVVLLAQDWVYTEQNDPRCRAFYRRLVQHKIALLPHVGDEQAMVAGVRRPAHTRRAARGGRYGDCGARRIAWRARWPVKLRLTRGNVSKVAELVRGYLRPDAHHALANVAAFGRTYRSTRAPDPRQRFSAAPASTVFLGRVPMRRWWNAWKRENPFCRDFEIKQGLGLPEEIWLRGYKVLAPRIPAARA